MRMDRHRHVLRGGAHFDREHAFRDQLAGAGAADADAKHPLALGVEDQLGDAVGPPQGNRAARGAPRELGDRDLDPLLLGLGLGLAGPRDLGIGEDDGRYGGRL